MSAEIPAVGPGVAADRRLPGPLLWGLSTSITVLDQITKEAVRLHFRLGEVRPVIPGFFNLTYVRNTGAAWGLFGNYNDLLTLVSLVMLGVLVVFRRAILANTVLHRLALAAMIGGILGNLLDRLRLGWVVDFLDFHVGAQHWPAFNVADAAICFGVGIYVLTSWRPAPAAPAAAPAAAGAETPLG